MLDLVLEQISWQAPLICIKALPSSLNSCQKFALLPFPFLLSSFSLLLSPLSSLQIIAFDHIFRLGSILRPVASIHVRIVALSLSSGRTVSESLLLKLHQSSTFLHLPFQAPSTAIIIIIIIDPDSSTSLSHICFFSSATESPRDFLEDSSIVKAPVSHLSSQRS